MDQEEQAWYCSCGFLNEGLDSVCRSCGLSLEEARSEVWRQAQATAKEGSALHLGSGLDAAQAGGGPEAPVTAPGTPGGILFTFLAGEPPWRRRLASAGGLGAWFSEPAPRFAAFLALLIAWISRISLWLSAAGIMLLGVFQLVAGTSMAAGPDLKDPNTWISIIEPQEAIIGSDNSATLGYTMTNLTDYPVESVTLTVKLLAKDDSELWSGAATLKGLAPHDTAQLAVGSFPTDSYFQRARIMMASEVKVDPAVAEAAAKEAEAQAAGPEAPPAGPETPEGEAASQAPPASTDQPGEETALPPATSPLLEEPQMKPPSILERALTLFGLNQYAEAPAGGAGAVIGRGVLLLLGAILYGILLLLFAEAQFHGLSSVAGMLNAACDARDTLIARRGYEIIEKLEGEARYDWRLASSQATENLLVFIRLAGAGLFLLAWAASITLALLTESGGMGLAAAITLPLVTWFIADLGMKIALCWPFASRSMAALSRLAELAG